MVYIDGVHDSTEIYKLLLYAYFLCRDLILIRAGDVSEKQYLKKAQDFEVAKYLGFTPTSQWESPP